MKKLLIALLATTAATTIFAETNGCSVTAYTDPDREGHYYAYKQEKESYHHYRFSIKNDTNQVQTYHVVKHVNANDHLMKWEKHDEEIITLNPGQDTGMQVRREFIKVWPREGSIEKRWTIDVIGCGSHSWYDRWPIHPKLSSKSYA